MEAPMKKIALVLALSLPAIPAITLAAPPVFVEKYEDAVSNKNTNVLVIFGTEWCIHCKHLKKDLKSFNLDDYVVCVVDAQERRELRKEYKLGSYPTSIVIKDGKEVSRKVGYEKNDYMNWLDSNRKPISK